jgi:hypothetical protein
VTEPFADRPTPVDPWGHEAGEDVGHQLDAWGHVPHHADPLAHMVGDPRPVRPSVAKRALDPKVAIGILVVVAAAIAVVLVVLLG